MAERWGQPSVLGELLAGIGAGNLLPPLFGERGIAFVRGDPTLHVLAEIGVLILLFDVGLEADLRALARVGPSAALVAAIGVVAPFVLGWGTARWLLPDAPALAHLFVGATLTATSIGITARVLKDLGSLQSREGQVILGAAVLDDILGLVVLAVITGLVAAAGTGGPGLSGLAVAGIVLKAFAFLGLTVGLGHWLSGPIVRLAGRTGRHEMLLVFGLTICFTLAFAAEWIGLAGIVGAFAAGLLLDPYGEGVRTREEEKTLSELLHPLSNLFVPLFFVLMGIQVDVASLVTRESFGFGVALVLVAVARQAGVRGRRGHARDQSARGRDRDGPAGRGGPHLRGDRRGAHARRAAPPLAGGLLGSRPDGGRHDASDAGRDFAGPCAPRSRPDGPDAPGPRVRPVSGGRGPATATGRHRPPRHGRPSRSWRAAECLGGPPASASSPTRRSLSARRRPRFPVACRFGQGWSTIQREAAAPMGPRGSAGRPSAGGRALRVAERRRAEISARGTSSGRASRWTR